VTQRMTDRERGDHRDANTRNNEQRAQPTNVPNVIQAPHDPLIDTEGQLRLLGVPPLKTKRLVNVKGVTSGGVGHLGAAAEHGHHVAWHVGAVMLPKF